MTKTFISLIAAAMLAFCVVAVAQDAAPMDADSMAAEDDSPLPKGTVLCSRPTSMTTRPC